MTVTDRRFVEKKEFEEEILQINRVTKVVKGGKILRFRVVVVIGDKKGRVGIGVGKAREIPSAITKGFADAKRKLIQVPLKNNTIPSRISAKIDTAHVFLAPAVPGTGLVAGRVIRAIAEKAGIQDILSKSIGTSNPLNVANATLKAFKDLQDIIKRKELRLKEASGGNNETKRD
ncbi:MAG: 30S ribosomal protein S5 [Caldiserica bacterium]|nr:30S ribosomal protein S5 [Caldisericota bacterium]